MRDRRRIFDIAKAVEAQVSGASGLDVAACVFGSVKYEAKGGHVSPFQFASEGSVIYTGTTHRASCMEEMTENQVRRALSLPPTPSSMQDANQILVQTGLNFPEAARVTSVVPRAKMTGRCGGGCMICTPPLTQDEEGVLRSMGFAAQGMKCVAGVEVEDDRFDGVPPEILDADLPLLSPGQSVAARAASNIALVKYWGKRPLQMACNPSISLLLPFCETRTRVEVTDDASKPEHSDPRVRSFVNRVVGHLLPKGHHVHIETRNDFPSSCGIASSASGFAALVRALAGLTGMQLRPEARFWMEQWARLGSGSAVRSVNDETLVAWKGAVSETHPIPEGMQMEHMLMVFDPFPKAVGSTDGHAAAPTSPFFSVRAAMAEEHVDAVVEAMREHDFDTIRRVSESEAMSMHMVMATSSPPIHYLSSPALEFVRQFVEHRNAFRLHALFTIDAGANIHLLWLPSARDSVLQFTRAYRCMFTLHRGVREHWYRCILVSGKRYSGKTTLCDTIGGGARVCSISERIKRDYWETHVKAGDFSDFCARETKEEHREKMVRFMKSKCDEHGERYWLWRLWDCLPAHPRTIVVSDARREVDLDFFKTCTQCVSVRIECSDATRKARGRVPSAVDEMDSETGLDRSHFDIVVKEGGSLPDIEWSS